MEGMGGAGLISGQFSRKFHPSKLNIKKTLPEVLKTNVFREGFICVWSFWSFCFRSTFQKR